MSATTAFLFIRITKNQLINSLFYAIAHTYFLTHICIIKISIETNKKDRIY